MSVRLVASLVAVGLFGAACFLAGRFSVGAGPALSDTALHSPKTIPPARDARSAPQQLATSPADAAASSALTDAAWRELNAQPATLARNTALAAAIEKLAISDPKRALALADAEGNRLLREQLLQACLRGWAHTAPDAAAAWALRLLDPAAREASLNAVFQGAVAGSPEAAIRTGRALMAGNPGEAAIFGGHLIDALCDAGLFETAGTFALSGDASQRAGWLGTAYSRWAALQPEAAAAATAALTDAEVRSIARHGVIGGWSEADPASAVKFAIQLTDDTDQSSMISQALRRWTKVDLKAASDWINQHELGPAMDEGVASIATQDYLKPDVATSWAESVVNPSLRSETLTTVLRRWATTDLAAARRYFESTQQLLPEDRQEIAALLATLAGTPPAP